MMFCDRGHENYFATGGVERTDYFIGTDAQDLSADDADIFCHRGHREEGTEIWEKTGTTPVKPVPVWY